MFAGAALTLASGGDALLTWLDGWPPVTLPTVIFAALAVSAFAVAAELLGWIRHDPAEPKTPKNDHVHGAARPASEAETQLAATGKIPPKPAQDANYLD